MLVGRASFGSFCVALAPVLLLASFGNLGHASAAKSKQVRCERQRSAESEFVLFRGAGAGISEVCFAPSQVLFPSLFFPSSLSCSSWELFLLVLSYFFSVFTILFLPLAPGTMFFCP